ncbi:MAG: redoxin domain-containing protein [Treponema sp.]|nr:redoxin domain-containing protein [Treponema sp.]
MIEEKTGFSGNPGFQTAAAKDLFSSRPGYRIHPAKGSAVLLCAAALIFGLVPKGALAQDRVSPQVEEAFKKAGIPVLRHRINPVDFSLPLLKGGTAKLSSYRGKAVILNFWATWCPPCRAEMPAMEALYRRFKSQGLEMLAVNCGEETLLVENFIKNNNYSFPVPLDRQREVSGRYGISAIPSTYILDRDGKIILRITGSVNWEDSRLNAAIDTLLKDK